MQLSPQLLNAALNGMTALLNTSRIRILSTDSRVLADLEISGAFPLANGGAVTSSAIEDANADASGEAATFEIYKGTDVLARGTIGIITDANVDMRLRTKTIVAGTTFRINSITINAS